MFKFRGRKGDLYGILDTSDNSIEFYPLRQIVAMARSANIIIDGLKEILDYFYEGAVNDFKKWFRQASVCEFEVQNSDKTFDIITRDWGSWYNPPEAEDEEDYDWQKLEPDCVKTLERICRQFENKYGLTVRYEIGEKNYIYIMIQKF